MTKLTIMRAGVLVAILATAATAYAALPTVTMGTNNFVVVAGSTITNTGSSVINGDLGLSPGTAVTGFPPGTVNGTQHVADALASQTETAIGNAYNDAAGRTPVSTIPTQLGGAVLHSGVYDSTSGTFGLTGTLTLDAQGDPNAVFIFKTSSTLITAGSSTVVLTGGAQACNVFWQVGSSATLGANSTFKGNILALTSATLTTGAKVEGGVFARNGAVTLDSNTITRATCAAAPAPAPTPVATTTVPVIAPVATTTVPVVVVATTTTPVLPVAPTLPNTGFGPDSALALWGTAILGATVGFIAFLGIRRKFATIS